MNTADLSKFVEFVPAFRPVQCQVDRAGRRGYQHGKVLGTLKIKYTRDLAVLVEFPDGAAETFLPSDLVTAVPDPSVSDQPCTIA